MFVPPVGFAGNFCWGIPGKKSPLDFSNSHTQFLGVFFFPLRTWCITHVIYLAGIKHAVLDSLPGHPSFHGAVGWNSAVPMVQVAGLSAGWLSVHSTVCVTLFVPVGQSNFVKEAQPKLVWTQKASGALF